MLHRLFQFIGLRPTSFAGIDITSPVWSYTPMLNITIELYAQPPDAYARGAIQVKGKLEVALANIAAQNINIQSMAIDHTSNIATIVGTTPMTIIDLAGALYGHVETASRMKRLRTDLDLANLSAPQRHVPTEEEIRAQQGCTCGTGIHFEDDCPIHMYSS